MIHHTQSAKLSQKQDGHSTYVIKKQCALPVITTLGILRYIGVLRHMMHTIR